MPCDSEWNGGVAQFTQRIITHRGFGVKESARVAELMLETLKYKENAHKKSEVREEIRKLCAEFPIPDTFV